MVRSLSLVNHFLIAMPNLGDPNFFRTVTLVCEHNSEGAMGVVINRPLELTLGDVIGQMDIEATDARAAAMPVHLGGPVQGQRGFVLHEPLGEWQSTLKIADDLGLSASRDVLEAMARGEGPARALLVLGYAGWGEGQLEQEIADNAWLSTPASREILFHLPAESRWHAAVGHMGIDLTRLSGEAGHA